VSGCRPEPRSSSPVGEPAQHELLTLEETGLAVVRSPQPQGTHDHITASYLTLTAGFHSRTHKHADDLSVTWFDGGQELLVDAGRFGYLDQLPRNSPARREGYFYGRPERQYVESTRAHNTAEMDGRNHERRTRPPYGSALRSAEQRDGHFRLVGEVDHGLWSHRRQVVLRPGRWLSVTDRVVWRDDAEHDMRIWWNLPGELPRPSVDGSRIGFSLAPGAGQPSLWIEELRSAAPIEPDRGATEPLRGWRSRKDLELTPAWSTGFVARGRRRHTFVTLFTLGAVPLREHPPHPFDDASAPPDDG
jgi:hypothetical protein